MKSNPSIEVFSTCPPSSRIPQEQYLDRLIKIAQWSEAAGCTGILVFSDNSVLDPWALSHVIIQHTNASVVWFLSASRLRTWRPLSLMKILKRSQ